MNRSVHREHTEREALVETLVAKGIKDEGVLAAIYSVPRHTFVDPIFERRAYEDSALPIDCQQTISQPYTVAKMTELLQVKKYDKVLEVGTGSGYQACILAEMGARVFTIERHLDLLNRARKMFDKLGYNIASRTGDGTVGWSEYAPYDGIIVTAGAPEVPQSLVKQLADGGRLVIPTGSQQSQSLVIVTRKGSEFGYSEIGGFKFVPLVGKEGWQK
ncbi:MAG: protein-L-isoaspartate O-methyltransferase [Ectothiorhodospiraceae bacterium]|nr:protein-L-isoaspartate O-methyltransferase [Ectothiorhodospiraceae bacterium]